jgi:phosphoribosyl-AMP cyclohydrolase
VTSLNPWFGVKFNEAGLVPVVAQSRATGQVLMLAWANREALEATQATGYAHYWSRSRGSLWKKGDTSGHLQNVVALHLDCDNDAVLYVVDQTGPACHTGEVSCFFQRLDGDRWQHALPPQPAVTGDQDGD